MSFVVSLCAIAFGKQICQFFSCGFQFAWFRRICRRRINKWIQKIILWCKGFRRVPPCFYRNSVYPHKLVRQHYGIFGRDIWQVSHNFILQSVVWWIAQHSVYPFEYVKISLLSLVTIASCIICAVNLAGDDDNIFIRSVSLVANLAAVIHHSDPVVRVSAYDLPAWTPRHFIRINPMIRRHCRVPRVNRIFYDSANLRSSFIFAANKRKSRKIHDIRHKAVVPTPADRGIGNRVQADAVIFRIIKAKRQSGCCEQTMIDA